MRVVYYWGRARGYTQRVLTVEEHTRQVDVLTSAAVSDVPIHLHWHRYYLPDGWYWDDIQEALEARGDRDWGRLLTAQVTEEGVWYQESRTPCPGDEGWVRGVQCVPGGAVRQSRIALMSGVHVS